MKVAAGFILGASLVLSPALARAEWPEKPITLVVPYAAGGYTDAVGRITARFMETALKQTVVVENRAGGGGIVGSDLVSKSKPDGYTLCMCSVGAISIAPIAQKTEYDPVKSFSPISIVSTIPQTVIVNPSLPIKSMDELVTYAREHPGELNFGSSGAGGLMFFSVALFQSLTNTEMVHVPFGGGAPATAAVVAGEVDLSFTNMTDALPQMEANNVRALAVTSAERSPFAADLPTVSETVAKGYNVESWNAVMAPAGTPDEIVQKVSSVLQEMAKDKDVVAAMANIGAQTVFTKPEEFSQRIAGEVAQWDKLLTEIGVKK
ncbi:MFS transporter [Agaricicola taiwanensis]|uniref:MFS transporter n=1 Tax=Agaricicola taiwanensis TaxID=591372 RepID=A0A8J2YF35_9RHOB|nr:tripartite tricarboxylate transporter substrate binding protein [Agaricicola taiwanensis]GGE28266.1 MFS transporter [Agaricicola taiwanensis]